MRKVDFLNRRNNCDPDILGSNDGRCLTPYDQVLVDIEIV